MRRPFFFFLAATVPLLLYARTVDFDFVHADDADLIVANRAFLSDLRNVPAAFVRSYFEVEGELTAEKTYYRPAAIASFMIDAARGGADPRPYHATNVALHAATACLLFALALTWGAAPSPALIAALVFAVHPVNVQAVAWVAGRNDLLVAVFGLTSLLAWAATAEAVALRHTGQPRRNTGRRRSAMASAIAAHTLAFALALFSKETGLLFPLMAILQQRVILRLPLARVQWIALAADAAIVLAWLGLRSRALAGIGSEVSTDALRAAAINLPHVLIHAGKIVAPLRLNVSPSVDTAGILLGAAALLLFAWLAARPAARRLALFGGCWTLAFLLPTLVVPGMPVYEHRAYLPLMGVLVSLAIAAHSLSNRQVAAFALVAITFATLTYRRQEVFRDAFAYWRDGTRDAHFGPIAHVNLGQLHESAGRPGDARREYLRALERDPTTPKAHNNLGVVLMALNEPELAAAHFKEETSRHPWNADAWFNLGLWNEMRGNQAEARRYYERAIAANPAYRPAHEKLGKATEPAARVP